MSDKELSAVARAVANGLKENHTLDKATSEIKFDKAEDVFAANLPAELSFDQLKAAQEFMLECTAGHTLATGEIGQKEMQADPELKKVTSSSKLGHSRIDTSYDRTKSGTAMGKPWVKHGVASSDFIIGVGRKATHYKDVVSYLGDEAAKVFGS